MQNSLRHLLGRHLIHEPFWVQDLEFCQFAAEDQAQLLGQPRRSGLFAALNAGEVPGIEAAVDFVQAVDDVLQTPSTLLACFSQRGHATPPRWSPENILLYKQIARQAESAQQALSSALDSRKIGV
jgi:hypothetical protein